MLHGVIMAGGSGERFWPLSRKATPKQLLKIVGRETMIEQTAARLKPLIDNSRTWVVTTSAQGPAVKRLLPGVLDSHILREPMGRNTAPCVALAAYAIAREDPEAVMVVLPADHVISPKKAFQESLRGAAAAAAETGSLVTIGITPTFPATGYGYIRRGKKAGSFAAADFYRVDHFIEKPDPARARRLIRSPLYTWNSGIFIWSFAAIDRALEEHLPEVARRLRPLQALPLRRRGAFLRKVYPGLPSVSIDYGIMEKHRRVLVAAAGFQWDDVGSWAALTKYLPPDQDGNRGRGEVAVHDSSNCLGVSTGPLIGLVGVCDLVVMATGDAVLVCPREKAQDVKKLVEKLRGDKRYRKLL
jgi:mannose-1-phosphate guanylyltransferase